MRKAQKGPYRDFVLMNEAAKKKQNTSLVLLLIILLIIVAHGRSVWNGFALDDDIHIVNNPLVSGISESFKSFKEPLYPGNLYRPAVVISYAMTNQAAGKNPLPYHLINIALHIIVTCLIFYLLLKLFGYNVAAITALIFAVHPVHTEVVSNVTGRAELLSLFFGALYLILFIRKAAGAKPELLTISGLMLCLLLSLFSKESGVMFFALAYLIWFYKKEHFTRSAKSLFILSSSGLVSLGIYLALRYYALGGIFGSATVTGYLDNPLVALGEFQRVFNAFLLLGKYVLLTIFPAVQSSDYSYAYLSPVTDWTSIFNIFQLLLFVFVLGLAVFGLVRKSIYGFGALWFFLSFAVTANVFFPIGTIFGERLAYLPSVGLLIIISAVSTRVFSRRLGITLLCLVLAGFCTFSWLRSAIWKDNYTLHSYQINVSPESAKTQQNFATALRNKGNLEEAKNHFLKALEIYPDFAEAAYGLGTVYLLENNIAQGLEWLKKSNTINPNYPETIERLGRVYLNEGKIELAKQMFKKLQRIEKNSFRARIGLLAVAINSNDLDTAVRLKSELTSLEPENPELKKLSATLNKLVEK